ncbi:AAA ATPase domain protein [uncultured archaeon]|nr:AAA ATPase domain protein [uncultured archaeon]
MNKEQNGIQIRSAEIDNFRGIKECKIDDLSLVNLFIGINNSRKSTILDAIYIGCKEFRASSLIPVIKERVQREVLPYEIFYSYDENSKAEVKLKYNPEYEYSISFSIAQDEIDEGENKKIEKGQLYSCFEGDNSIRNLTAYVKNKSPNHLVKLTVGKEIDRYSDGARIFSSTINKKELTTMLDAMLGQIKINRKKETDLINRMSDIYREEFDYEFIPRLEDRKDKRVAFGNERIFSDFHGDGMQRALLFLSALELTSDTAIFIEEIEMFQHPKALKRLAKHTVDLAMKNRIQLFITTHNYDTFVGYALDTRKNDINTVKEQEKLFRSYILTNKDGIVDAKIENDPTKIADELHFND